MTLVDDLQKTMSEQLPYRCTTCSWVHTLNEKELKTFNDCLEFPELTLLSLWKVCRSWGLEAKISSFRNHVRDHHVAT